MTEVNRTATWQELFKQQGWLTDDGTIQGSEKGVSIRFREGGNHPLAQFRRSEGDFLIMESRTVVEYYLWDDIRNVIITE